MTDPLRVHFLRDLSDAAESALRARLDSTTARIELTTGSEIPDDQSIDMLIAGRPTEDHLRACGAALKYMVIPWSGLPESTRELMRAHPQIAVHNLHHNAIATAEMAVSLLLAAAKVIVPLDRDLRRGDWSHRYRADNDTRLLHGQTALVFGYGAIGQHAARILRAFGMNINAIRRSGGSGEMNESGVGVYGPEALYELLPRAKFLVLCVPLTDETSNMIGERELALIPPGAVLVNVGRGAVIDEQALFEALKSRRLHAAGLDVWYNYPQNESARSSTYPSEFPFHVLDNVVLSPHRGGAVGVEESEHMRWKALAEVINAAAQGREVPNRVDIERGY